MTPEQFNKWLEEMKTSGFADNDEQCAKLIGVSRRTMVRYKAKGATFTVALACNNITKKLGPYV